MSNPATPCDRSRGRGSNPVCKSGSLLISSKGLGWKSWKRRWFVLTHTSLVFYKSDPNALSKGNDTLALGGIELNNSGTVHVREEKKLLTVLFPDGRAFTLKAETMEDLEEWKVSLKRAIAAAPSAESVMGQSGIFKTDSIDAGDGIGPLELVRSRKPVKSMVVGRPILLALEDIDGSPSFLEKALCFIEEHGVHVEGILRQSADVDEVEHRVREYEQGKSEFGPEEDAHVIGDCIKHVLRELPSLPVPTPCCSALLESQRKDRRETQVSAMRTAVAETFPEPNRRLLQRVLKMMRTVAAHANENRMTASAVAACMAPLLLKPLLTGECGLEDDSDISGDNSAQLLAAAAAANSAQAIITTLLEEYESIFEEERLPERSPDVYARVDDASDDASSDGEVVQANEEEYQAVEEDDQDGEFDEDPERLLSGSMSESSGNDGGDVYDNKVVEEDYFDEGSNKTARTTHDRPSKILSRSVNLGNLQSVRESRKESESLSTSTIEIGHLHWKNKISPVGTPRMVNGGVGSGTNSNRAVSTPTSVASSSRRSSLWGLSAIKKSPVREVAESSGDDELIIQRLEATRNELRNKIAKEAKGNAALQQSLERRKQALHERRLVLEQDVLRLQEQLQAERELRAALEIGLTMSASQFPLARNLDSKTRVEFEEIAVAEADVARLKQRVAELHAQLTQQQRQHHGSPLTTDMRDRHQRIRDPRSQQNSIQQESFREVHNKELQDRHDHTSALELMEAIQSERSKGMNTRRQGAHQESVNGNDWRALRPPAAPVTSGKQFAWRRRHEVPSSARMSSDVEASNAAAYQRQGNASSALAELTTRLDFFKERRSQLVEQLQNLDSSMSPSLMNGHDFMYASSPPWTQPG